MPKRHHPHAAPAPVKPRRRLLLPILATLPAMLALLGLGTWQVERLLWKTELLDRLAAAEAAPAQPASVSPAPFSKVMVTGRFDYSKEAMLEIELRGTTLGGRVITPLMRDDGPPVLVDRGWAPFERDRPVTHPEGEVTVTGWVRPAETAGWSSATDDVPGRRFYTFNPAAIGAALGLPAVAPWGLVAMDPAVADTLPQPSQALPRPNNNHLGYAITWYGLAAALVGVFLVWARRRLKENP
ncbi:SURF1 family protein [Neoroseomonas lacus]|uniref:SURF1-like protein n=1 Tax=Neoroseomonas lacus TaxID=287609 RepID=A0A917NUM2_9PROT|nr:SURF1 family cytochrome oxidase biogenesis protein [Neoroseomonas lacus]GGJ31575.1 SURF1-like protein [Neoroseomonas lacus]